MKIIILEDDHASNMVLTHVLQTWGHMVTSVLNLTTAKQLTPEDYDLLITDFYLPDGTGIDLAKKWCDRINIIFISAEHCEKQRMEFLRYGQAIKKAGIAYTSEDMFEALEVCVENARKLIDMQARIEINIHDRAIANVEINE